MCQFIALAFITVMSNITQVERSAKHKSAAKNISSLFDDKEQLSVSMNINYQKQIISANIKKKFIN
jgi:hypothetical protein